MRECAGRSAAMKITIIENGPIILDTKEQLSIDAAGSRRRKYGERRH